MEHGFDSSFNFHIQFWFGSSHMMVVICLGTTKCFELSSKFNVKLLFFAKPLEIRKFNFLKKKNLKGIPPPCLSCFPPKHWHLKNMFQRKLQIHLWVTNQIIKFFYHHCMDKAMAIGKTQWSSVMLVWRMAIVLCNWHLKIGKR